MAVLCDPSLSQQREQDSPYRGCNHLHLVRRVIVQERENTINMTASKVSWIPGHERKNSSTNTPPTHSHDNIDRCVLLLSSDPV